MRCNQDKPADAVILDRASINGGNRRAVAMPEEKTAGKSDRIEEAGKRFPAFFIGQVDRGTAAGTCPRNGADCSREER